MSHITAKVVQRTSTCTLLRASLLDFTSLILERLAHLLHILTAYTLPQVEELGILVDRDDQASPQSLPHLLIIPTFRLSSIQKP